jgi:hypothetical protein
MQNQNLSPALECDGALSDLILQAARQALPKHVDGLIRLPDVGARNQPLLPLLVGLIDATQQVAQAVADNAWDESIPLDRKLMADLARQSRATATAIESASDCPDARNQSMTYIIVYKKANETIQLGWIVPFNWSEAAIREAFYCQYSGAEIVSIKACREGCLVG